MGSKGWQELHFYVNISSCLACEKFNVVAPYIRAYAQPNDVDVFKCGCISALCFIIIIH